MNTLTDLPRPQISELIGLITSATGATEVVGTVAARSAFCRAKRTLGATNNTFGVTSNTFGAINLIIVAATASDKRHSYIYKQRRNLSEFAWNANPTSVNKDFF